MIPETLLREGHKEGDSMNLDNKTWGKGRRQDSPSGLPPPHRRLSARDKDFSPDPLSCHFSDSYPSSRSLSSLPASQTTIFKTHTRMAKPTLCHVVHGGSCQVKASFSFTLRTKSVTAL